jgi:toxin FitB
VTVGELARWAEKRHWGTRVRTELVTWLGRRVILPYDERVAWKWGQLSILSEQRGRARPMNMKDFGDFAAHDGLRVIGPDGR